MANCDIIFNINGEVVELKNSGLSSESADYETVAKCLIEHPDIVTQLRKILINCKQGGSMVPDETYLPNGTIADLLKEYGDIDWDCIDLDTKILRVNTCYLNGQDIANKRIIRTEDGKQVEMFVVENNKKAATTLRNYLYLRNILSKYQLGQTTAELSHEDYDFIKEAFSTSSINEIVKSKNLDLIKQQAIDTMYATMKGILLNIKVKKGEEHIKEVLENQIKYIENRLKQIPSDGNAVTLLMHYLENNSLYENLHYGRYTVSEIMDNLCANVLKLDIKSSAFEDIFARQLDKAMKFSTTLMLYYISTDAFINVLRHKFQDIYQSVAPHNTTLDRNTALAAAQSQTQQNTKVILALLLFFYKAQNNKLKSNDYIEIFNLLKEETDEDFSYSIDSVRKGVIYINNVPQTYKLKYASFKIDTQHIPTLTESYKGYNIYELGGQYYVSKHILSGEEFGLKTNTIEDSRKIIDKKVQNTSIAKDSLIELNLRTNNKIVYLRRKYKPGEIIKSFNASTFIDENSKIRYLQDNEMAYHTIGSGMYMNNTLPAFYDYIIAKTEINPEMEQGRIAVESLYLSLREYIDTPQKAVCLLYALNNIDNYAKNRGLVSVAQLTDIINTHFSNPTYEYFLVEDSGWGSTSYHNRYRVDGNPQPSYKTVITAITEGFNADKVAFNWYDSAAVRQVPSMQALTTLAEGLNQRFNVQINVISESDLEELMKENNIEIPGDTKGFVHNGLIYVVQSRATCDDIFHEFTHIMLGVLKSQNYDNYLELMRFIGTLPQADKLKRSLKAQYKGFADLDLNEEVFARIFGEYLFKTGNSSDLVTSEVMTETAKQLGQRMRGIFGTDVLKLDNANLNDVLHAFGTTLAELAKTGNGLELNDATPKLYRLVTNWIAQEIRAYEKALKEQSENAEESSDAPITVGIIENC